MKIRNSFVSNSSSTNFIVQEKDYDKYKNRLELYKVKDLYFKYKSIMEEINDLKKTFPCFMSDNMRIPYWEEIEKLYKSSPNVYISDAHDRDSAYRDGIDLERFEDDL